MKIRKILFFAAALCLLQTYALYAASLNAYVDKNTVEFGDNITLSLEIESEYGKIGDYSPLMNISSIPGFRIVGTSRSSSTRIVNGKGMSSVRMNLTLTPEDTGELEIPGFSVTDSEGNPQSSKPIKITVKPRESLGLLKGLEKSEKLQNLQEIIEKEQLPAPDVPKKEKKGFSLLKTLLVTILAGVIYVLIKKLGEKETTSKAAAASDVVVTASVAESEENVKQGDSEKFDFMSSYAKLSDAYSERTSDFYKKYFELFKAALASKNKLLSEDLTFDEVFSQVVLFEKGSHLSRQAESLKKDAELVLYAGSKPARAFNAIHSDVLDILNAISPRES